MQHFELKIIFNFRLSRKGDYWWLFTAGCIHLQNKFFFFLLFFIEKGAFLSAGAISTQYKNQRRALLFSHFPSDKSNSAKTSVGQDATQSLRPCQENTLRAVQLIYFFLLDYLTVHFAGTSTRKEVILTRLTLLFTRRKDKSLSIYTKKFNINKWNKTSYHHHQRFTFFFHLFEKFLT